MKEGKDVGALENVRAARYRANNPDAVRAARRAYRLRHPDKVKAADKAANAERMAHRRTRIARFKSPFDKSAIISDGLAAACKMAAGAFTFQSAQHTLAWFHTLEEPQREEIIALGMCKVLTQMAMSQAMRLDKIPAHRASNSCKTRAISAQSKAFKHIVEKLDEHTVDGKKLGDCTRPDLLRAAARLEIEANEMTLDATLYRQFAAYPGMLKAGTRLRDLNPNERRDSGMLKLLMQRWGEDEEAA